MKLFCHYMFCWIGKLWIHWHSQNPSFFVPQKMECHRFRTTYFSKIWSIFTFHERKIIWAKKPWFLRLCGWSSEVRVNVWQEVTLEFWNMHTTLEQDPLIQHCVSEGDWDRPFTHNSHSMCALSREKAHTVHFKGPLSPSLSFMNILFEYLRHVFSWKNAFLKGAPTSVNGHSDL